MWLLLAFACTAERNVPTVSGGDWEQGLPSVRDEPWVAPGGVGLTGAFTRHRASGHRADLEGPVRAGMDDSETVLSDLGAHLVGVDSTDIGADALEEALDDVGRRAEQYGLAALTSTQLFGDAFHPGVCSAPVVTAPVEWEGDDWTLELEIPTFLVFQTDPTPEDIPLPNACENALIETAGDLDAALDEGCVEENYREFMPEGSDCRACVEGAAGDYSGCADAGSCEEEATVQVWFDEDGEQVWYEMNWAYIWGCAPDWGVLAYVASLPDPGHDPPPAFDHERWGHFCIPTWNEDAGEPSYSCVAGLGGAASGDALLEGIVGRVQGIYPEDEPSHDYRNMPFYADTLRFDGGAESRWMWGFTSGAGIVSRPRKEVDTNGDGVFDLGDDAYGYVNLSWGLDPYALRPDGTDPTNVDDTFAREWLATLMIKTSTTRNGVPIMTYDHSRCASWTEMEDGTYRCAEMGTPEYGWLNDVLNAWSDEDLTLAQAFPISTIASSGLPDPDIPGGVVPEIYGSTALGDPEWDACTWPRQFKPDRALMEDEPTVYGGPASLWADTWNFDGHPEEDLRMILAVNQPRDFCPLDTE